MSIKKWLMIGFGIFLSLIVVLVVVSHIKEHQLEVAHERIIGDMQRDMFLDEERGNHAIWLSQLADLLLADKSFGGELDAANCSFIKTFRKEIAPDIHDQSLVNRIDQEHHVIHNDVKKVVDLYRQGNKEGAITFYSNEVEGDVEKWRADVYKVQADFMGDITVAREEIFAVEKTMGMVEIVVTVLALVVGLLTAFFLIKGITQIVDQLKDNVNQLTTSSQEILVASEEQSAGASEQSAAVAETTSAAKELSKTSEQVGESIQRVAQAASHALSGMEKIKETISKTNDMVSSLGEKSQKISKITELIDDVADQTNLLAVNASIEAARAGEQGRGFTVVADEIRKLADSTANSTKDITELIEIIQHEMSNAVLSMETSVGSVDEEARLAQETTERAKEIAMSANQQITGSKQIAEAMSNVDGAMQQISAAAKQSATAVQGLMDMAKELEKMIKVLG